MNAILPCKDRLLDYIDFIAKPADGSQYLFAGPIHTSLIACEAAVLATYMGLAKADPDLQGAIVVAIGGHMGYGWASSVGGSALVNLDINGLQPAHHAVFARNIHAALSRGADPAEAMDRTQHEARLIWKNLFEGRPLEGAGLLDLNHHAGRLYRRDAELRKIYERGTLWEHIVMGLDDEGLQHTARMQEAGQIYNVVADIRDALQMQQVGRLIDDIAERMGKFHNGVRTVPVIVYGSNTAEWNRFDFNADFYGRECSKEAFWNMHWNLHDLAFGFHGMNNALLVEVMAEEPEVLLKRVSPVAIERGEPESRRIVPSNPHSILWPSNG